MGWILLIVGVIAFIAVVGRNANPQEIEERKKKLQEKLEWRKNNITTYNIPFLGKLVVKEHINEAISKFLEPSEKFLGAFHGNVPGNTGFSIHHYMIITDKRIVFWGRGIASGSTDSFFFEDISSAEEIRKVLGGEIVLNIKGAKEHFTAMVKQDVPVAIKLIRDQISNIKSVKIIPAKDDSVPDLIKKLAKLKEDGILTEDEFNTKKADLLKRI